MPGPDLLVDYDELEHISALLDDYAHDMAEDKSNICYDEVSTVSCNKSAYDNCIDQYRVRQKIIERVADTSVDVSNYGITFSDVESKLISTKSELGKEVRDLEIDSDYDPSNCVDFEIG